MQLYSYDIKIPKERVAVLIGKKGSIKKNIEIHTESKIEIDSEEGDVTVTGKDPLKLMGARDIILAVGRGFNPDIAQLLLKSDYSLEILNIKDFTKTTGGVKRLKGRVIGQDGRARRVIEELTSTYICVYGKTIGIIGEIEGVTLARRAIESLLQGSPHRNVYKWLEKQKRNTRIQI